MTSVERPATVLAGFDGSVQAVRAVRWAAREAASRQHRLHIVHVVRDPFPVVLWPVPLSTSEQLPPELGSMDAARRHAEGELAQLAQECHQEQPRLDVDTTVLTGHPVDELSQAAADAELVVLGSSGRSRLSAAILGLTATELVRELRRPVVVVRGEPQVDGNVVVGVDGSEASDRAVEFAFDFASRHGVGLVAVHAWADLPADALATVQAWDDGLRPVRDAAEQLLEKTLTGWQERYPGVSVRRRIVADGPTHALAEEAGTAQLLVVGSHGRGALGRLVLGSVSHAVLQHAPCPVAVVRGGSAG